ncbi:MAG: radical SAM protein, partial [Verrucomicrobiota bacterium]|nr:radical SAM protein [Verrucomicrobiota bacterium]
LEPRTSPPQARLDAVAQLREAGIPVGVMVAPIIPGLTDHEVPAILEACGKAGAQSAGYVVLRLPWAVAPIFERWIDEHFPDRKEKILGRVRHMRGGGERVYDSRWGVRQTGQGIFAKQIESMFEVARRRAGIANERRSLSTASFRRITPQMDLFQ